MPLEVIDPQAPPQVAQPNEINAYRQLTADELTQRCQIAKKTLGKRLLILGHHYQQDEVIAFADHRGDSYRLAQLACANKDCEFIIFCGVHFMAETADILTPPHVQVILPDLAAGCSMADMADLDSVEQAWEELGAIVDTKDIMPVTYINSAANLKAFCGKHGGIVCTSSNARAVLDWSFKQRSKVLFFPDQHLGRNTAKAMGIPLSSMALWDPLKPNGGNHAEQIESAKVLLWKGHCSVHQMFKTQHVEYFRNVHPQAKILVHPECSMEVVDMADLVGSTEFILRTVRDAPDGTEWAIGTELHLVNRLKQEHPSKTVHFLSTMVCMCATMYRIDLPHLCWALEKLVLGQVVNRIQVPEETAEFARQALERMLTVR